MKLIFWKKSRTIETLIPFKCIRVNLTSRRQLNSVFLKSLGLSLHPTSRLMSPESRCRINLGFSSPIPDKSMVIARAMSSTRGTDKSNSNNHQKSDRLENDHYLDAINDLNLLQSNTQTQALAKFKNPENILPIFKSQLELAGLKVDDLNKLNIIHVSGTKGKGSTCAFIESILRSAKLKTGFYNSPHLVKVTERIRIDGQPIDEDKFSKYFRTIYTRLMVETRRREIAMPAYFSFLTILGFHIFIEEQVDVAIIEVGIGGNYDPTNIVQKPVVCGVTTLDFDHTNILGNTIDRIAWSKAGIVKPGAPLFTIEQDYDETLGVIRSRANSVNVPVHVCKSLVPDGNVQLGIEGHAQYSNASLACAISAYWLSKIRPNQSSKIGINSYDSRLLEVEVSKLPTFFVNGLKNCSWSGRCQVKHENGVTYFLDGAHTRKSMENCLAWFLERSKSIDPNAIDLLMINVIGERDKREVLRPLTNYEGFYEILFCSNRLSQGEETPKSETFINMKKSIDKSIENVHTNASVWNQIIVKAASPFTHKTSIHWNVSDAISHINGLKLPSAETKKHVLVTGSLHFVGAAIETLEAINQSDQ